MDKLSFLTGVVAWLTFAYTLITGLIKLWASRPRIDVQLQQIDAASNDHLILRLAISNHSSKPAFISRVKLRFEDEGSLEWLAVTRGPIFLSGNQYREISTRTAPMTINAYDTVNDYFAFFNFNHHAWPISDKKGMYRLFVTVGKVDKSFTLKPQDKFVSLSKELDLELGPNRLRV